MPKATHQGSPAVLKVSPDRSRDKAAVDALATWWTCRVPELLAADTTHAVLIQAIEPPEGSQHGAGWVRDHDRDR